MSAKEQAIIDIQEDLAQQHKCFLAFRSDLNPVMRRLVRNQIKQQQQKCSRKWRPVSKANSQLVAVCLFSKSSGDIQFNNYSRYYEKKESL